MMNSLFGNEREHQLQPGVARADRHRHLALRQADRLDGAGGGRGHESGRADRST